MEYEVKLEIFEGPLDLLIYLIHKNEVDIFDIPIATITDQYLAYIEIMESFNINLAGDFLVMASTLIHLKSKMLLPQFLNEDEEDPRLEITRPLLEYMKIKEISEELSARHILDRDVFTRAPMPVNTADMPVTEPEIHVNLFQLLDAFKRIVDQRLPGEHLKLVLDEWSVKDKTDFIIAQLKEQESISFHELFKKDHTISEYIVTFLALLEIVHMGIVKVYQATRESEIQLKACFDEKMRDSHDQSETDH